MKFDKKTTAQRKRHLRDILIDNPDLSTAEIRASFAEAKLLPAPGHGTIAEARASARKSRAQSTGWTREAASAAKTKETKAGALEPVAVSGPARIGDDQVMVLIGTTKSVADVLRQVLNHRRPR